METTLFRWNLTNLKFSFQNVTAWKSRKKLSDFKVELSALSRITSRTIRKRKRKDNNISPESWIGSQPSGPSAFKDCRESSTWSWKIWSLHRLSSKKCSRQAFLFKESVLPFPGIWRRTIISVVVVEIKYFFYPLWRVTCDCSRKFVVFSPSRSLHDVIFDSFRVLFLLWSLLQRPIEFSICDIIVVQKSSNGDIKFAFYGWDYYFHRARSPNLHYVLETKTQCVRATWTSSGKWRGGSVGGRHWLDHGNILHNTNRRQKELRIILWRLLLSLFDTSVTIFFIPQLLNT